MISERPLRVTIVSVFVLSITAWNAMRTYGAIANWNILREFGASPAYIMATGLVWTMAGMWLAYVLWTRKRSAFWSSLVLAGLYFTWYWLDRLFVQSSPAPNFIFASAVSTLLLALFILGIVWAKSFFEQER